MIIPVIMAGGAGTRMWPASRKALPKQFAPLLGGDTLFQQTVKRLSDPRFDRPCVISAEECRFIARDQMGAAGASNVLHLVEPVARNTAAAVLTAALAHRDQPEAVLLISPSDHVISDEVGFHAAVDLGRDAAAEGEVVCFGVFPTHPSSAYGYLQVDRGSDAKVQKVTEFIEKPDAAAATNCWAGATRSGMRGSSCCGLMWRLSCSKPMRRICCRPVMGASALGGGPWLPPAESRCVQTLPRHRL